MNLTQLGSTHAREGRAGRTPDDDVHCGFGIGMTPRPKKLQRVGPRDVPWLRMASVGRAMKVETMGRSRVGVDLNSTDDLESSSLEAKAKAATPTEEIKNSRRFPALDSQSLLVPGIHGQE